MSTITLDDIKNLPYEELNNLTTKIMYLMIKEGVDEDGWATISVRDFGKATSMTDIGVRLAIKKLLSSGLVEKNEDKEFPYSTNQYRIINED